MSSGELSPLLGKISELELYITRNYPATELQISSFLSDLKAIEPNLSVIGLLNHLTEMYRDGSSVKEIIEDVKKTKKVFSLAGEYVKTLEEDFTIASLSEEIHSLIISHLERALQLYKYEYDVHS